MGTYSPHPDGSAYLSTFVNDDDGHVVEAFRNLNNARYQPGDEGPSYELSIRIYIKNHNISHTEILEGVFHSSAMIPLSLLNEYVMGEYTVVSIGGETGEHVVVATIQTAEISHIHTLARLIDRPTDEDIRRRNFRYVGSGDDEINERDSAGHFVVQGRTEAAFADYAAVPRTWNEDREAADLAKREPQPWADTPEEDLTGPTDSR